jgi:hypothetical protein
MDGSQPSLAGRVGLRLAVLLVLLWGGSGAQRVTTDAPPPQQAAVRATLMPPSLAHHGDVVRRAARHDQGNRHRSAPAAVLAAGLVGAVAATSRREQAFCPIRLDGRLLALRPRAPPFLLVLIRRCSPARAARPDP